jgi:chaperonin cofactor prefoldin
MVHEYRQSVSLLQSRIDELNAQIRTHKGETVEVPLNSLADRRYKLYQEIWELQAGIRAMMEYIEAVEGRGAKVTLATA